MLFNHLTTFKNSATRNITDQQKVALKFIQNITTVDSSTNGLLYSMKKKVIAIIFATYSYFSDEPIQSKLLPKTDIGMTYLFEGLSCYKYCIDTNQISSLTKLLDTLTFEDKKEVYLAKNSNGETLFHKTAWCNHKELLFELLTKFKGNKEILLAKDHQGQTLLHIAVWTDNTSLIVAVINKLSDDDKKELLLVKNNDGDTIFDLAKWKGNTKLIANVQNEV